jgi:hypothetical protein
MALFSRESALGGFFIGLATLHLNLTKDALAAE